MELDDGKMRYIIRARGNGESYGNIALQLSVSGRRVEQLYSAYRFSRQIPSPGKGGRRPVPITDEESRIILAAYKRCVINTVYLEGMIENDYAVHVSHERIHRMLRMNGLVTSRKSWIRRKVRHERESSNSLWHIDWHEVKAAGEGGSGLWRTRTTRPGSSLCMASTRR